ncbi:MAG: hypothetical protein IJ336_03275 [Lachnospiraceae bacterium]|nr:hypothetical protein [Lachnospiraceae bacterium]
MKDIITLIRQRKDFYLTVLVLTLLLTIVGAFYNLSVGNEDLNVKLNIDSGEQMLNILTENTNFYMTGMSSEALMNGFMDNWTYMGFVGLNFVILVVIIFSYFNMRDKGTKEFLETLPVKKFALELYNYVALVGILLINIIVATMIHLLYIGSVNRQILDLAKHFPELLGNIVPADLVAVNNVSLLYQFGMLALYLVAMTTFWYVCSALFKMWPVGLTVGVVLWFSVSSWIYNIRYLLYGLSPDDNIMETFSLIVAPFDPILYFNKFVWNGAKCSNPFTIYVAIVLIVMLFVMIGIMILHAYVRELSRGKLFYINALNVVSLLIGGIWLYSESVGYWGWGGSGAVKATFVTVIAGVIAIYFLYHKKERTYKLTVTEKKSVKNPVLAQGLKSYLIATGIITLVVEYIDIGTNLEWLKHAVSEWSQYYEDATWLLNEFSMYWRYQFAMLVIAGFIIFKCISFAMENTKASREFFETLPMSRTKVFCTKLLMDLGMLIIPLAIYSAVSIGYLLHFRGVLILHYDIPTSDFNVCIGEQFLLMGIILCMAIFFMGVMYLIDAVTVNGTMKNIFCGVAALFGFIVSMLLLEMRIPLLMEFVAMVYGELNPFMAMVYLVLGILLLIFAGNQYIHRDKAKEIFYYKWAKYAFAILLSLCYLIFVLLGAIVEQSVIQYFLATMGSVLIFFLVVYYSTPGKMAELRKRFVKKSSNKV